jgi:hypothetical protein
MHGKLRASFREELGGSLDRAGHSRMDFAVASAHS